ncbi:ankyrin repeat and MYND domain-containing protein 1 isoform X2 [Mastacembelus armatus]|uniref:ankyrin repeat and MYND domain-containing protein 1 isoform X2 n=1 Tax=Mastacembelus armatus TaxID=205130 RepID=UPI000E45CE45|nr:ankyrin repeat and MYND domain-containing protein 1-like isoform X2 [Mastacembelus armatus]
MLSKTCQSDAAAPVRGGLESGSRGQSGGHGGAEGGEETRQALGVQEWSDGSRYEGEFMNGLKHGSGRYTWTNGEYYEGSFYKDYRHGDGVYCWSTGHKFIGKFYLNRKEGYGRQLFPDGTIFQGLYHADRRFGPGVVSYPDGRQDVGLWLGERLLRLCTSVEEGFSLKRFPEYSAYMDPAATTDCLTQPPSHTSGPQTKARTHCEKHKDRDPLPDESFVLPPGMESFSTDGDHLPLPPGRRRELDKHCYGELWEPETNPHQGYERDPLSTLPLQARMHTHIHKHRLQAENVDWDVAAVLSLNREGFGPKGPLEVSSEQLIQDASQGELQAVSQILQSSLVHPDVADSQGHTALIAATVNCHNDVIQLLLDMAADIDKLNCEGMSALAVCHVLYYPFQSLHNTLAEAPTQTQILKFPSASENSPQISQMEIPPDASELNNRPQTNATTLSSQTNQSHLSDQTAEELTEHISHQSYKLSSDSELITEGWSGLNEAENSADTGCLQREDRVKDNKETEGEGEDFEREESIHWEFEEESKMGERTVVEEYDQRWQNGEREVKGQEKISESRKQDALREEAKESEKERAKNIHEEDVEEREERGSEDVAGVERFIQVLDGHIALGSVKWKECRSKAVGRVQGKDRDLTQSQTFDSARSVNSYSIEVTEEVMQRSAEALSHTGIPQRSDTQETVRKMAAMKIEHRARLDTLKLLLERGADPNISTVPMSVLFLAIMAADTEAVRRLLLCGARTDIPLPPERKGLYPLHVAAALPGSAGPRITELLLHALPDPDAQACDQDEIYEPDKILIDQEPLSITDIPNLKVGGRTALHVACQRDSDCQNASEVVALLLSHSASTDLLWSGHSPLSLAIASGNDLAVEELLKWGADPNIPLGPRVGSALCAVANINYHYCGNRIKLLDMLAKAGADILMPVMVGNVVGTAIDYAYYSFNQDSHIVNTPFHALNMREREILKVRRRLLSMMGGLVRQPACQRETAKHSSTDRKRVFKFCYHCGRSVSMKLTACSRCQKVFYCSTCFTLKASDKRHKDECIGVSASADGIQKRVVFKSQRGPRPMTKAVKVLESQVKLKENYSYN